jgi:hypothetical protein
LRLRTGGTFEEFRIAVLACLEHHFDNHIHCGTWCTAKGAEGEAKEQHSLRFRSKTKHSEMYAKFSEFHEQFMEEDKLVQLFHAWDTNGVESFNKRLTKFLPKDRTYCFSIENKVRIHVAVGLQSVGYRKFYERVLERTGIAVAGDLTFLYLRGEDVEKEWKKDYKQLERVKARRLRGYFEKIRKERQKMISDNNRDLTYNSNMMMERQEEEGGSNGEQIRNSVGVKQCSHCGLSSHQRKTHRLCPMNKKYNLANDEKNKMREAGTLNDGLCM